MDNNIKVGDKLQIHCYKHDGSLHRTWDEATLLEIHDDYLVFGNNQTTVVDADGKVWKTKEPAIMFFFKDRWFNIIGQLKDYGIYFYCNIATPALIDNKVIENINDINDIDEEMIEILENIINGIDKDVSIYDLATTEILKDAFEVLDTLDASEEDLF